MTQPHDSSLLANNTAPHSLHFKQCHDICRSCVSALSAKATCSECFRFPGKLEATCVHDWTLQPSKSRSNTSPVLSMSCHGFSTAGTTQFLALLQQLRALPLITLQRDCLATWLYCPVVKGTQGAELHRYSYTEIYINESHQSVLNSAGQLLYIIIYYLSERYCAETMIKLLWSTKLWLMKKSTHSLKPVMDEI